MHHPPFPDLVGYLVGKLLPLSPSFAIAVVAQPDSSHTTTIKHYDMRFTTQDIVQELVHSFAPALLGVWRNDARPGWYYLQFDEKHPPTTLFGWSLPVAVYATWTMPLDEPPGLVGLSISPHAVDKVEDDEPVDGPEWFEGDLGQV